MFFHAGPILVFHYCQKLFLDSTCAWTEQNSVTSKTVSDTKQIVPMTHGLEDLGTHVQGHNMWTKGTSNQTHNPVVYLQLNHSHSSWRNASMLSYSIIPLPNIPNICLCCQ